MADQDKRYRRFFRTLLDAMGLSSVAGAALLACGGNVVVDPPGQGGAGAGGTTSTTQSSTGASGCEPSGSGTAVQGCIPMQGDFCPPGSSSEVLEALADALGVCAETSTGGCCNEPALTKILCDLPPGTSDCCYVAELQDSGLCL